MDGSMNVDEFPDNKDEAYFLEVPVEGKGPSVWYETALSQGFYELYFPIYRCKEQWCGTHSTVSR
ncbi:hypothetical protein Pmar_PMAR013505 [Perkinsus marinus ATCC 50983]|uniref:Uncharacterized protein n=1 Tax=Perkinsus marinus (strain ATCC 50983 / TXsc) TaxID=423536 RepID=C5LSE8_PERM5|nr:hypothetical protein Pmar_PMAR013505 [Perkinsus marinus ATCC 50983]EER00344.1 hypothetical protein Pmar_PMAR013505 [Perkinsus marinus ATCC 50983]|eukprot:XP_002767626.1 hypothetical protein Pmar_PMAR013505 [Perkinsus marinus ATCC 50983]